MSTKAIFEKRVCLVTELLVVAFTLFAIDKLLSLPRILSNMAEIIEIRSQQTDRIKIQLKQMY